VDLCTLGRVFGIRRPGAKSANRRAEPRGYAWWALVLHGTFLAVETSLVCAYLARVLGTAFDIGAPLWDAPSWAFYGSTLVGFAAVSRLDHRSAPWLGKAAGRRFHSVISRTGLLMWVLTFFLFCSASWTANLIRDVMLWREPGRDAVGVVTGSSGGHTPRATGWWQVDGHRYSGDLPYNVYQAKALNWQVPFQVSVHNPAVVVTTYETGFDIVLFCIGLFLLACLIDFWHGARTDPEDWV
jgi:hypothetical protein